MFFQARHCTWHKLVSLVLYPGVLSYLLQAYICSLVLYVLFLPIRSGTTLHRVSPLEFPFLSRLKLHCEIILLSCIAICCRCGAVDSSSFRRMYSFSLWCISITTGWPYTVGSTGERFRIHSQWQTSLSQFEHNWFVLWSVHVKHMPQDVFLSP